MTKTANTIFYYEKDAANKPTISTLLTPAAAEAWVERLLAEAASKRGGLTMPNGRKLLAERVEEIAISFTPAGNAIVAVSEEDVMATVVAGNATAGFSVAAGIAGFVTLQKALAKTEFASFCLHARKASQTEAEAAG